MTVNPYPWIDGEILYAADLNDAIEKTIDCQEVFRIVPLMGPDDIENNSTSYANMGLATRVHLQTAPDLSGVTIQGRLQTQYRGTSGNPRSGQVRLYDLTDSAVVSGSETADEGTEEDYETAESGLFTVSENHNYTCQGKATGTPNNTFFSRPLLYLFAIESQS